MTRVLLTGCAGFIGSHVAEALVARGDQVAGVDNFDPFYDRGIKDRNLVGVMGSPYFRLVEGDVRDGRLLAGLLDAETAIVHIAARAGVRPSLEDPALYTSVNVGGTVTLLEAARNAGARRFVLGSSSSVYGDDCPAPFVEDCPAVDPVSPYAASKRAGELYCRVFAHLYDMRIIALRFFTVVGPRQRPDLAVHKFTRLISSGLPVPFFGDGSTERDYTYVGDIVSGVLAALDWTSRDEMAFEVVNLGECRTTRLDELIGLLSSALEAEGLPCEPILERLPPQPGDVRRTCADINKARRLLGYDPSTPVETSVQAFVRWFKESQWT